MFSKLKQKREEQEKKQLTDEQAKIRKLRFELFMGTTSKCLIWFFSINGALWIWSSYVLAFMGKYEIAETLSGKVCDVVIGGIVVYLITKTVENIFKYNEIGGMSLPTNYTTTINKEETLNESNSFN